MEGNERKRKRQEGKRKGEVNKEREREEERVITRGVDYEHLKLLGCTS